MESIKYLNRLIELIEVGDNVNIKQRLLHLRNAINEDYEIKVKAERDHIEVFVEALKKLSDYTSGICREIAETALTAHNERRKQK